MRIVALATGLAFLAPISSRSRASIIDKSQPAWQSVRNDGRQ
jgi:hypothetical protein